MYAIVKIAGKQYKVAENDQLRVAHLSSNVGDKIKFEEVLFADDGKAIKVGNPAIKGASVAAELLEHGRSRKVLIYKKKRRKGYKRKNGHRQGYSLIKINGIKLAATAKKAPAKKPLKRKPSNGT